MPLINYPVSRQSLSYPLLPRHQNILPAHLQIPTHNCSTLRLVPVSQLPEHQHCWQQGEVPREIYQRIRRFPQTNCTYYEIIYKREEEGYVSFADKTDIF